VSADDDGDLDSHDRRSDKPFSIAAEMASLKRVMSYNRHILLLLLLFISYNSLLTTVQTAHANMPCTDKYVYCLSIEQRT